jgi:hypothetical protein
MENQMITSILEIIKNIFNRLERKLDELDKKLQAKRTIEEPSKCSCKCSGKHHD